MKCKKCDGSGHLFYGYDDCSYCDRCEGEGVVKMKKTVELECLKDWTIESGTYFEKGKKYNGFVYNDGKSIKMIGELGMEINFHEGSEYFSLGELRTSRPSKPAKSGRPLAYKPNPEPSKVIMTDEDKKRLNK
jgi:hypothetical protein